MHFADRKMVSRSIRFVSLNRAKRFDLTFRNVLKVQALRMRLLYIYSVQLVFDNRS